MLVLTNFFFLSFLFLWDKKVKTEQCNFMFWFLLPYFISLLGIYEYESESLHFFSFLFSYAIFITQVAHKSDVNMRKVI